MKSVPVLAIIGWLAWGSCLVAVQPAAELTEVTKIWDQAPHCAFTDLAYWKDQFVCAFREGRAHVSTDGKIRILTSPDGSEWKSASLVTLDGYDLRDAGLSTAPDGRLMLIGGAAPRKTDKDDSPTGAFVSFSEDGVTWTKPQIVSEPGRWLWRVTWHEGKAYGVSYAAAGTRHTDQPGAGSEPRSSALLASDDGIQFRSVVPNLSVDGWPTEAVLRFDHDDTAYCLQRRDGQSPLNTAMLGTSKPPYAQWEWADLELYFGGPNFIEIPDGRWVAAGRVFRDDGPKTELAWLDVNEKKLTPFLQLPSGGDTSYPGLVWHAGTRHTDQPGAGSVLWVSYYSSHEGKANIYLAKVKLNPADAALTAEQSKACERLGMDEKVVAKLVTKPLYKFTEAEVDTYLQFLSATEPDLRKRIVHLAQKNVGQPYEIYLLGEMPFEPYDPQPLYCLGKSDCLVFTEHTYAMALSHNWPSFMRMLQRLRYRDGKLGVATRNHYTEADWNISNRWLVEDITEKLAGDAEVTFEQSIDRAKFLKNRYGLEADIAVERHEDVFLPFEEIARAKDELRDGDFVNVVRGVVNKDAAPSEIFGGGAWVGHVGLIVHGDDGTLHMIHSTEPRVREEPIAEYIARSTKNLAENDQAGKARLLGFKFLRLRDDPLKHLREIDGDDAPRVTLPDGGDAKF